MGDHPFWVALFELQYTESTILPKLQEQLKQKEKEIENIVNAVQKGYATETLLKRLDGLEKEKREISDAIAKEQLKAPIFSQDHFKMALSNFRKIDITTQEGKRKIIDTFINAIYLYDDHLKIIYNANGKEETISLAELESSTLFSRGAPRRRKARNKTAWHFAKLFSFTPASPPPTKLATRLLWEP